MTEKYANAHISNISNKKNLLVTLADINYIDQAKQVFSSVYFNAGWNGDYLLLAHEIPEIELEWFRNKGILIKEYKPMFDYKIGVKSVTVLTKLSLFTPEFKKWDNIVFLDGDVIVRGSIDELTKVKGIAAVRIFNTYRTLLGGQLYNYDENMKLYQELDREYDLNKPALNSGVLAFSTDVIKDEMLLEFRRIIQRFGEIILLPDECVLNLYFYDKWQELPAVYNFCPGYEMFYRDCKPDELKGIILHTYSALRARRKAWDPRSPLYREWNINLKKAELIDLSELKPPRKTLSKEEAIRDGLYLKNLHVLYFSKYLFSRKHIISQVETLFRHYLHKLLKRTSFAFNKNNTRLNFLSRLYRFFIEHL